MPPIHWFLAIAAVSVWGTNFVVIAWGLAEFPPYLFCTLRFACTALPWIFFVRRPPVPWRSIVGFGLLIGVGQLGLLYFAMHRYITPGLASLLVQTQVVFTILLSLTIKKQRIKSAQALALLVALLGIAIVIWESSGGRGQSVTLFGVLLVLGSGLCWSLANMLVQATGNVNVTAFLIWSSATAVPPLILLTALLDGPMPSFHALASASTSAWGSVLYQTFGNTFFAFGVWNWLLARHSAATVTPIALLVPVVGMTSSAWLLGESLPAWKLLAASLVLIGLAGNAYASRGPRAFRP
jgi:O-acetylserine/cysteine efflux transporter